jgi:hypothetical protein
MIYLIYIILEIDKQTTILTITIQIMKVITVQNIEKFQTVKIIYNVIRITNITDNVTNK